MRTLIKAVSRIVTAQAGSCCGCRFHLEDKYGKYLGYESHSNWELWHQDHDNINFEYFLKCTGCGYELAKQYWRDSDWTFVDYTDGIDDVSLEDNNGKGYWVIDREYNIIKSGLSLTDATEYLKRDIDNLAVAPVDPDA